MKQSKFGIVSGLLIFSVLVSAETTNTNKDVEIAVRPYQELEKQLEKVKADFPEFKKNFEKIKSLSSELVNLSAKLYKMREAKMKDEAEISMLEVKEKSLEEARTPLNVHFYKNYPLIALALDADDVKTKPNVISEAAIVAAVNRYRTKGMGMGLVSAACIDKDGFKVEKKCVSEALEFCGRGLSNDGTGLSIVYVTDDLEIETEKVESADDWFKYLFDEEQKVISEEHKELKPIIENLLRAAYSGCKLAANRGVKFKDKNLTFRKSKFPSWYQSLVYGGGGSTEAESVSKKCLSESGAPTDIASKIARIKVNFGIEFGLQQVESAAKDCTRAVSSLCENTYFVKDQLVYPYRTTSCKIREVTAQDVEQDMRNWRRDGTEEAAILAHSVILDDIKACDEARKRGYFWTRKLVDLKGCKKTQK